MASLGQSGTEPDFVREAVFHSVLLAKMAHEKMATPARMIAAIAGPLAAVERLGGYAGSGDVYRFVFEQVRRRSMLFPMPRQW